MAPLVRCHMAYGVPRCVATTVPNVGHAHPAWVDSAGLPRLRSRHAGSPQSGSQKSPRNSSPGPDGAGRRHLLRGELRGPSRPGRSGMRSASAGLAATCAAAATPCFWQSEGKATVAGYLVGAVQNPALQDRFADIGYFRTDSPSCAGFSRPPAHQPGPGLPQPGRWRPTDRRISPTTPPARRRGHAHCHRRRHAQRPLLRALRLRTAGATIWNGHEVVFPRTRPPCAPGSGIGQHGDNARHR